MTLPNINRVSEILPTAVSATPRLPFPGVRAKHVVHHHRRRRLSTIQFEGETFERRFGGGFNLLARLARGAACATMFRDRALLHSLIARRICRASAFRAITGREQFRACTTPSAFAAAGDLPFGKGKHFLNQGGWANASGRGVRLNGLATLQSGTPLHHRLRGGHHQRDGLRRADGAGARAVHGRTAHDYGALAQLTRAFANPLGGYGDRTSWITRRWGRRERRRLATAFRQRRT